MYKSSMRAITVASAATAAMLLLAPAVHAQSGTQTYNGNLASGFGGTLGNGSLKIASTTSAVTFTLNPSGSFTANDVVVYIDSKAGGVGNTSTFTDNGDNGRESISGYNAGSTPTSRSLLTFPTGFTADYALEFENNNYIGFFDLSTPTNFGYITGGAPTSGGPYTQTITDAQLGLAPGASFKFVASLISTTAYRSNETIGASTTTPGSTGDAPNAGFNGSTTFSATAANTYITASAAPEPGDLAMLTFGASLLGGVFVARRRRAIK